MWRKYANCSDVSKDVFIIKKGQTTQRALWFCETCVVKKACLGYALDNNCIGIWGGTTQKQRAKIKRQQKLSNAK
jgi:WhiB family redox-sensing transcriptional regulator